MPNELKAQRAETVFVRCEKVCAPVFEYNLGLGMECITSRLMAAIADRKDKLLVDVIMDYAERNGVTDLFLIDEEFVRSAIIHEAERRANDEQAD